MLARESSAGTTEAPALAGHRELERGGPAEPLSPCEVTRSSFLFPGLSATTPLP